MPILNATKTIKKIAFQNLKDVKIIGYTALLSDEEILKC